MATSEAPAPFDKAWDEQRRSIFRNVGAGAWWGTIASEPGTVGDIARTSATARRGPPDGVYLLTGQKNFGSGSGVTSYMITVAVLEGEITRTCSSWICEMCCGTGRRELRLRRPGMATTQSHAFSFKEFPVTRMAWPGQFSRLAR